jgi:hypothetical protein
MPAELKAKLSLDTADYQRKVKQAKDINTQFGVGLNDLKSKITSAFTAGAIISAVQGMVEMGKEIRIAAEELDVLPQTAQAWDIMLQKNGSSVEKLASGLSHLAEARKKALLEGPDTKEAKAFSFFGISGDALKNSPVAILREMSTEMTKMSRTSRELTSLRDLLGGKVAMNLRGTLSKGLSETEEQIRAAGGLLDTELLERLEKIERSFKRIKKIATASYLDAAGPLVTLLEKLSEPLGKVIQLSNVLPGMLGLKAGAAAVSGLGKLAGGDPEGEAEIKRLEAKLKGKQKDQADREETEREIAENAKSLKPTSAGRAVHHDAATNLVALGNFAFTRGGQNPMEHMLGRSVQIQQKIEQNTRPNKSVGGGDSSVP